MTLSCARLPVYQTRFQIKVKINLAVLYKIPTFVLTSTKTIIMSKTLVIHPKDRTTDFLRPIYDDLTYKTIVTSGLELEEYERELNSHERIFAMGHGSPSGLFGMGLLKSSKVKGRRGAICADDIDILKGKDNVYIWCNADEFVNRNNLSGFYTGMFISEVGEARCMGVGNNLSAMELQDLVDISNDTFAEMVGAFAEKSSKEIYTNVKELYGLLAEDNIVARYNHARLYYSDGSPRQVIPLNLLNEFGLN